MVICLHSLVLIFLRCKKIVFQLIAPAFCVHCYTFLSEDLFLCNSCQTSIIPIVTRDLFITDAYQAKVFAISNYKEPLRSLTLAKQYGNRLASKQLGQLLWQKTDLHAVDFDCIVPVPLHWTRYAWRWFNQADVIAQELSKASGKPVIHLLKRNRNTGYQAGLSREKRLKNLCQAFTLLDQTKAYKGKKILLVDDVMTTGTTLKTCARELIKVAPEKIFIAVACRTF